MLRVARLEELDGLERVLEVSVILLQLLVRGGRRVLPRRRDGARRVASREMELVDRDEDRLRQVHRRVVRRRDYHRGMHAIQHFVGQAAVLSTENERDGPGVGVRQRLGRGVARTNHAPLRGTAPGGESEREAAVSHGLIEGIEMPDVVDQVAGVVRDTLYSMRLVCDRTNESQIPEPHVLHRAHGPRDVDGVLRLDESDRDAVEAGRHPTSTNGSNRVVSWRSPTRYTNSPAAPLRMS